MAKRGAKKKVAKRVGARARRPEMDFHGQMVLFRWALAKFGVETLAEFSDRFDIRPETTERSRSGATDRVGEGSVFFQKIRVSLPATTGQILSIGLLTEYDQRITEHTQAINTARVRHSQEAVEWKYHQYLALLFTEMFLDRYFADAGGMREELNEVIAAHNERINNDVSHPDWVTPYLVMPTPDDEADPREQLSRLAFWCATGSGKTLLMHMHIKQFKWYHERGHAAGEWPKLDQVILVTPNDGLSEQHAKELIWAGFEVVSVGEAGVDGLFADQARRAIKILSIHKFRDGHGKSTVATEAFAGCNLVLVDEGHRGTGSGGEGAWLGRRNQLAEGGFTFEYSATFKEGLAAIASADERDRMRVHYARSILFDYAYRSFYRDGYGKDFTFLNLKAHDEDKSEQRRYLTAALLLFYQQMRVWMDGGEQIKPFRIDKPLWIFVGHTVTGGKVSSTDDKVSVSDVVEVLLFVRGFLKDPAATTKLIRSLLEEGMVDDAGRDILADRLRHLDRTGDREKLARELHEGILRDVFHAPGGGRLTVQLFREATGELALRVGEGEPFGVVNVGEPGAVAEACEANGITPLPDDVNRASLFHGINRDDSTINLLVGSRKFTEGWNSWRVSSIGLMNMGRGEGTQIIQLFGRGVRLRGYGMSLRRSMMLTEKPEMPKNLRQVETLQVFGIKASYIDTFSNWIDSEVPKPQERRVWDLPVVKTLPERRIRTLRLQEVIDGVRVKSKGSEQNAFRVLGPLVRLRPPDPTSLEDEHLREHPTRLNWLPRIRGIRGEQKVITATIGEVGELPQAKLTRIPIWFFDIDALLFGLEALKATKGLDRLHADRSAIRALLEKDHWYTLYAAEADMRLDRYENREQWQRMAQQLINSYAERFYRSVRARWESPYLEVVELGADDPSMIDAYTIETTELVRTAEDMEVIAEFVRDLQSAVKRNPLVVWSQKWWRTVPFTGHLYQPLLYVGKNTQIRMSPVALNEHEAQFVGDLAAWCGAHVGSREVSLLRNQSVTGLGFFVAGNFYPDFLLWVQDGAREHLVFVEPHGLQYEQPAYSKMRFAKEGIPRLQEIVSRQCDDLTLHAFILSNTQYTSLGWSGQGGDLMSKDEVEGLGVLFQRDDQGSYIGSMMGRVLGGGVG